MVLDPFALGESSGEWGGALKEFAAALAEAQKNADDQRMLWLRISGVGRLSTVQGFEVPLAAWPSYEFRTKT